jgi:copper chaperone CopZ
MQTNRVFASSIAAAIAASLCCIGPLLVAATGFGSLAFFARFDAWRPYLLGLAAVLLGVGLHRGYRAKRECCTADAPPGAGESSRTLRFVWLPVLVVAAAAAFPYYANSLTQRAPASAAPAVVPSPDLATMRFRVTGMTCEACASGLAASFRNLEGVRSASVEYASGAASVTYDPGRVSEEKLAALVKDSGYGFEH